MYAQVEKTKENKSRAAANSVIQEKSDGKQDFGFVDNRIEAITQRKLHYMASSNSPVKQLITFHEKSNSNFHVRQVAQLRPLTDYGQQVQDYSTTQRDNHQLIIQPIYAHNEKKYGNRVNKMSLGKIDVVQRIIATIGYDVTQINNDDPLVADKQASLHRSLALLKAWHGGEPNTDINSLTDIGNQAQPLNILGHGSPETIQGMSAEELAGRILRLKNKDKINAINLYSCSTHSKADGFAAQLKTILKEAGMDIPIKAPVGMLSVGQADSENAGTHTYPPDLRQALDSAKDKMLNTLQIFKQEADAKMQKMRDEHAIWEKSVNDRIGEVMKDDNISIIDKKRIIKIQTQNLISISGKLQSTINSIERDRKKVEVKSKDKYLEDRAQALKIAQPIQGDALTEVNAIIEESKLQELKQKAQQILDMIKFENTPFEELEWGEFQSGQTEVEWGEFVSATKVNE